jgi:hypothetical protein
LAFGTNICRTGNSNDSRPPFLCCALTKFTILRLNLMFSLHRISVYLGFELDRFQWIIFLVSLIVFFFTAHMWHIFCRFGKRKHIVPLHILDIVEFVFVLIDGVYCNFQPYFSYIVAVSFISGGNQSTRRKPPTCWSLYRTQILNSIQWNLSKPNPFWTKTLFGIDRCLV